MSMKTIIVILAASGLPLGPSGAPQTEPFLLTDEYRADYELAETCDLHPDEVDAVRLGQRAVYVVTGDNVEVLLDEYARRFALDYCWR